METNEFHIQIESLLKGHQLKKAIDKLSEIITEDGDWNLYTNFSEVRSAYSYMLEYMRMGMPDPNREKLYNELVGKCFILNDRAALNNKESKATLYRQYLNRYAGSNDTAQLHMRIAENHANYSVVHMIPSPESKSVAKKLQQEHEQLLREIFYRIWTSSNWNSQTSDDIWGLLTDSEISINDRATFVSAITLGLLNCFEPQKIATLCRLSFSDEAEISTRALIGIVLILSVYEHRIAYFPELTFALQTLGDSDRIKQRMHNIQIQLLRCRETQKIDRKMRDEIIPAMLKNPHLGTGKLGMDIMSEIDEEEKNPEWKEWLENDNIKDKLNEMAKWQMEGADVYMSTFSQLKRFPFFEEMCNWVRPFDTDVPQIADLLPQNSNKKSLFGAICSSRFFCNSDKYSFCFTFEQVPVEQRNMMMQQLGEEKEIASEGPETLSKAQKDKDAEHIGNQYIQDLYRFFKLSRYKKQFIDPFTLSLNILENSHLAFMINDPDAIMHTFNYLIDKEYYSEAYNAGLLLEKESRTYNADFYQKMGYSLQKEGKYREAAGYYTKADIISPDSLWTMKHIAQCYRLLGEYENALQYHNAALEVAPDNISLLLQTGECLAILKRYDEAFEHFFKVEYLAPESPQAWRAIAWCSFLNGKEEQARHYYAKLLAHKKAKFEDYINAGHTEWIAKKPQQAVELYKKAAELRGNTADVTDIIKEDYNILIERGATEFELALLNDILITQ